MFKQIILLVLLICPVLVFGQDTLTIQQVGEIPGKEVLSVDGDRILVRTEEAFQDSLWGEPITMFMSSITMYDISNPDNPEELDSFLPSVTGREGPFYIQLVRQRALLKDSLIIAISAPFGAGCVGYDIQSVDLAIFDYNHNTLWSDNIEFEQQEYNFNSFTLPEGIAVNDDFLYVGMGIGGIYVYDFSDPTDLEQVAHIDLICSNFAVDGNELVFIYYEIEGDEAYAEIAYLAVAVTDVRDPREPEIVDEIEIDNFEYELIKRSDCVINNDLLYLRSYGTELKIFTFRPDDEFELVAEPDIGIYAGAFCIDDDKLFVNGSHSLAIYSLDNPIEPEMLSLTQTRSGDIVVQGNYIYQGYNLYHLGEGNVPIYRFGAVGINEDQAPVSSLFTLHPVFPNPFNSQATVRYSLPRSGDVTLSLMDITGRILRTQVIDKREAGEHSLVIDGTDLPAGIYFSRLEANGMTRTQKLLLVK